MNPNLPIDARLASWASTQQGWYADGLYEFTSNTSTLQGVAKQPVQNKPTAREKKYTQPAPEIEREINLAKIVIFLHNTCLSFLRRRGTDFEAHVRRSI